jgi:catechol 2,3-dioxygenase
MRPYLSHLGVYVIDLPLMERFYIEVFNLLVTDRGTGHLIKCALVFLSSDSRKHHQLVLASGRPKEATFSTIMQISFKVETLDDLRRIWSLAIANGASEPSGIDHGNSWSIYFHDPEGNTVEVYVDTPFHVPQPHGRVLNLDMTDDEILSQTQRHSRLDPGFMLRREFEAVMSKRLT